MHISKGDNGTKGEIGPVGNNGTKVIIISLKNIVHLIVNNIRGKREKKGKMAWKE